MGVVECVQVESDEEVCKTLRAGWEAREEQKGETSRNVKCIPCTAVVHFCVTTTRRRYNNRQ